MSAEVDLVSVDFADGVAQVVLHRAERANSMNGEVFAAFGAAFDRVEAHPDLRAVVIASDGRNFSAGGDLNHPLFSEDDPVSRRGQIEEAYVVTDRMLDLPCPVVTAVQGRCAGAGMALVLASDLRVASAAATFSLDFARLGLVPDMGVSWLLASTVGTGRALDLAMTAEVFTAAQACEWGIVSRLATPGEERADAVALATKLAEFPPGGLTAVRRLMRTMPVLSRADGFALEIETMTRLAASPEARARMAEFLAARASARP